MVSREGAKDTIAQVKAVEQGIDDTIAPPR